MKLLELSPKGLYCPQAEVYIDPTRAVKTALITHGHSDHCYRGHQLYVCSKNAEPTIRSRMGKINSESLTFGEERIVNGVSFSFHPAGHIIGSSQIRVEYKGEVWVVSGDYKVENDGFSEAFEPIRCNTFITESTFGIPVYNWQPQKEVYREINQWWENNKTLGITSVLTAYSLGKAQRLLSAIDPSIGPIYTHNSIETINQVIRGQRNFKLPDTILLNENEVYPKEKGALLMCPSAGLKSKWIDQFKPISIATASGWMAFKKSRKNRSVNRGFTLSDHADWKGLNSAIEGTEAETILVTHGYTKQYSKWLNQKGHNAFDLKEFYKQT